MKILLIFLLSSVYSLPSLGKYAGFKVFRFDVTSQQQRDAISQYLGNEDYMEDVLQWSENFGSQVDIQLSPKAQEELADILATVRFRLSRSHTRS